MLIIKSSWHQKACKVICSSQHQNMEIRKEISALPKRPTGGNGVLIWSSCRNRSPYSTKWITWFVLTFWIHDVLWSDIFFNRFHTCVVAIVANLLNSNAFFVTFPSFMQISVLHCSQKTPINQYFFQNKVKDYICFFNFPAGNLIYYCSFCIKTRNTINEISVYNALPCKNVLEELAFTWKKWLPLTQTSENFWALCKSTNRKAEWTQTEHSVLYLSSLSITDSAGDLDPSFFSLCTRSAVNFNTTGKKLLAF